MYFFFLILCHAPLPPSIGCHAAGINSSFSYFLSALNFSNLVCQDKKAVLTREKIKRNMLDKKTFLNSFNCFLIVFKMTVFLIVTKMTVFYD